MNHGITVCRHNKIEWARMAQVAYRENRNTIGHVMSAAASMRDGAVLSCRDYDRIQDAYRAWLVFGTWPEWN